MVRCPLSKGITESHAAQRLLLVFCIVMGAVMMVLCLPLIMLAVFTVAGEKRFLMPRTALGLARSGRIGNPFALPGTNVMHKDNNSIHHGNGRVE